LSNPSNLILAGCKDTNSFLFTKKNYKIFFSFFLPSTKLTRLRCFSQLRGAKIHTLLHSPNFNGQKFEVFLTRIDLKKLQNKYREAKLPANEILK